MRSLCWGVLGSARIAQRCMIPALKRSRNGRIVSLGCRSEERAQSLALEHEIPRACSGYEEVLENPAVDAVYIPLPNHLHCEWTLKALQAGKHVLCEKPLARNGEEAQRMVEEAKARGKLLMEGLMYRFHPRSRRIKSLVAEGLIGEIRLVRSAFCFLHPDPQDSRFRPEMGGGALLDVGCYGVSLARWILGAEPEIVQGSAQYGPTGVDLTFVGILRFPRGEMAIVEASFVTALQQTFSVVGTRGTIELPHDAFIPWEKDCWFRIRGVDEEVGKVETVPGADEYQKMVEHFADAALGQVPLEVELEDSIRNMRVLDALAESAREGHPITISSM